jgi:hypothetical protein
LKLTITYEADADEIAATIKNLPDAELRRLNDMVQLLPELFPHMTGLLVTAEVTARRFA